MSRTLTFNFITDERFNGTKEELIKMDSELKKKIQRYLSVLNFREEEIRELDWPEREMEPAHKQWRKAYYIQKLNRKITWNDIYKLVNSIKPVPYKFL